MHTDSHYKLRRLASTPHEYNGLGDCTTEDVGPERHKYHLEPIKESLICLVFTRPPEVEATVKYAAAVREMLESVDLLHIALIALQEVLPLPEILELANKCRRVVNNLSGTVSVPIYFACSFARYYLGVLKKFRIDREAATENAEHALGAGIPGIMRACRLERESIHKAREVFENTIREFNAVFRGTDTRILRIEPLALKHVQILKLILHKFDDMEDFCRYYEHYFGFVQYQHLHRLLRTLEKGKKARAAPEENSNMIDLWTRYERFTICFPSELELLKDYSQAINGVCRICSTDFETSPISSIYPRLSPKYPDWQDKMFKNLERLGRLPARLKYWTYKRYIRWYHRMHIWLHHKSAVN